MADINGKNGPFAYDESYEPEVHYFAYAPELSTVVANPTGKLMKKNSSCYLPINEIFKDDKKNN